MATTTNYGWTTPDDTALVKDGASAIRSLGTAVDTTTKNLNPSTTLGDIEYRSSTANTNTRLAIGTTGQVLTVASGVPSWATPATPSSALTLIETATFTSTTSIISSAIFSSTYDNYLLLFTSDTSNDDTNLRFRTGSTTTTTGYNMAATGSYNTSPYTQSNYGLANGADVGTLGGSIGSYAVVNIANPYRSQKTFWTIQNIWTQGTSLMVNKTTSGFLNNTTSYDKFDVLAAGNISGFYSIYGYSK